MVLGPPDLIITVAGTTVEPIMAAVQLDCRIFDTIRKACLGPICHPHDNHSEHNLHRICVDGRQNSSP